MNDQYKKTQRRIRHRLFKIRVPGRRASDGLLDVNFPKEEQVTELEKLIEKKKLLKEEYPFDLPVMKERIQYSFIWDRFTLYEAENIEELVQMDPTDARFDLQ